MSDIMVETAEQLGVIDAEEPESLYNALSRFRLLPDNAIPIAPTCGERYQKMFDERIRALSARHTEWKANIESFVNQAAADANFPYESLVRTTVQTLVDFTYMKNPHIEVSTTEPDEKDFANTLAKLFMILVNKKTRPGVNLRPKVIRAMIYGHLTNFGILELVYQPEKGSLEQVQDIYAKVQDQIVQEEDAEKAQMLYELLDILQKELDIRRTAGLGVDVVSPFALLTDPEGEEIDLSDQRVIMHRKKLNIDFVKAEYTVYNEEEQKHFFKYNQEIELDFDASMKKSMVNSTETTAAEIVNEIMPDVDDEIAKLRAENTIPVVYVYDRTTKLKILYIEGRWDVPLWVYPDEMELSRFFPFFILAFSTPLNSLVQTGEVTHYKSFQDEINAINAEISKIRRSAFSVYLFNADVVDRTEIQKLFDAIDNYYKVPKRQAIGLKVRDHDKPLSELLEPLKLPTAQFEEIFNKNDLRETLDKITRISHALYGGEFKTNTTNDAVDTYTSATAQRMESLSEKIESCVEDLMWAMAEIVVSKIDKAYINRIISNEDAQHFHNLPVWEFNQQYQLTLSAGSTEKPNSLNKKKEAATIIQMLGQFGTAAPRTVLSVVMRLLRNTFSRHLVTDKDIEMLEKEGQAAMMKGISTNQTGGPTQ